MKFYNTTTTTKIAITLTTTLGKALTRVPIVLSSAFLISVLFSPCDISKYQTINGHRNIRNHKKTRSQHRTKRVQSFNYLRTSDMWITNLKCGKYILSTSDECDTCSPLKFNSEISCKMWCKIWCESAHWRTNNHHTHKQSSLDQLSVIRTHIDTTGLFKIYRGMNFLFF